MALKIDYHLTARRLLPRLERVFELSAAKIRKLERCFNPAAGAPVFTAKGVYTSQGWTEWTQGFQFGSALLQYDATGDTEFLELGRRRTIGRMAPHVSHMGVHDHGFNVISTYGNLWRLLREGRMEFHQMERDLYELALKVSGAVQASRWTALSEKRGFIYSFNGPHSLFIDTLRSLRSLAVAHQLGHVLMGEQDRRISLLDRLLAHALVTAEFNIYYGEGRDIYDVSGRTAHESIFNINDGSYRCPSSQQGYSPFTTWTRGLAWSILGFAEQLEFLSARAAHEVPVKVVDALARAALVTSEFYLSHSCADGIPFWDTGAPNLESARALDKRADPFNPREPVDSSAAVIAAQGLLRLGNYLHATGDKRKGGRFRQAGLTVASTLFDAPYLSADSRHEGLLLHSVYHLPKGWDHISPRQKVPNGESSMWGDYHARELAVLLLREARGEKYLTFFGPLNSSGRTVARR